MNETADVYGAQAQIAQDKDGDMGLPNVSPTEEYLLKKFALLKKKVRAIFLVVNQLFSNAWSESEDILLGK